MNYLAHLFFSTGTQNSLYGNLLCDFIKGNPAAENHEFRQNCNDREVIEGISLHQLIDKFTDQHPIFIQSKNRISAPRKRFSGIMIDVFYDHFLALNWAQFSSIDFAIQTRDWYNKLNSETNINLPSRMQKIIIMMAKKDLFSLYKSQSGISSTIDNISNRIRFENALSGGGQELKDNYHSLHNDFHQFFPELITHVEKTKKNQ